jgi:hypothetical protein
VLEEISPSALREIRQNMSRVCSGYLKRCIAARRNQQYFVSKNAEWLEQKINVHITVSAKTYERDYEMSCTSGIRGRRKFRRWVASLYL